MDRLTEIRTRIECYQDFLDSLEEITSALETNTGLGLFLQAESETRANMNITSMIEAHEVLPWIKRDSHLQDYVDILLALWGRANAKMGEIAFLLESSIEALENEEDEILNDMQESANRQKGADNE